MYSLYFLLLAFYEGTRKNGRDEEKTTEGGFEILAYVYRVLRVKLSKEDEKELNILYVEESQNPEITFYT